MKIFGYYTLSQGIRGVWIYAVRHIADALLDWSFWGRQFSLILIYVVMVGTQVSFDHGLAVVAPVSLQSELKQAAQASGVSIYFLEAPPSPLTHSVLVLDGPLEKLSMVLQVPDGDFIPEEEPGWARRLVRRLRQQAVLSEEDQVPEDKLLVVQKVLRAFGPMAIGGMLLGGFFFGGFQTQKYAASRDEGFFSVLRLGIPMGVTLFGALVSSSVIGLAGSLFYLFLFSGIFVLIQSLPSLPTTLLGVVGMAAAYGMGTVPGALLGTLSREDPIYKRLASKSKSVVIFVPLILFSFVISWITPYLLHPPEVIHWGWSMLPILGPLLVSLRPTLSGVLFTLGFQLLYAILAVRLTLYIVSLDEGIMSNLWRRVRR